MARTDTAPALLVFCALPPQSSARYGSRGESLYCIQDATIAATYAQLAAHSLGLVTCWVGAFKERRVADIIGIKDWHTEIPVAILTVGWPLQTSTSRHSRKRRQLDEFVYFH